MLEYVQYEIHVPLYFEKFLSSFYTRTFDPISTVLLVLVDVY